MYENAVVRKKKMKRLKTCRPFPCQLCPKYSDPQGGADVATVHLTCASAHSLQVIVNFPKWEGVFLYAANKGLLII